uniref:Si:dkey-243i1.1 n=1 Tax=Scleropages formosus TaxID=113540 RepID=A0A8C9WLK2_SCLFO
VTSPSPIVIEKLGPKVEAAVNDGEASTCSSMCFSVLSEERLEAAVRLAKRDLRRRRLESILKLGLHFSNPWQTCGRTEKKCCCILFNQHVSKGKVKAANPNKEVTKSGARVKVYSPQKLALPPRPPHGQSLPTRDFDPGTEVRNQEPDLSREIHRLQKELGSYIQKVEQLADKGERDPGRSGKVVFTESKTVN